MKKLFKSLFYSVVLGLVVMVSFTSCDKDEDDPIAEQKALLVGKTWEVVYCKSEKNNDIFEPSMKMLFTKFKSEYIFKDKNTFTGSISAVALGGIPVPYVGTWSLNSDGKTFILQGETGIIEKLTATEFELSFSESGFISMKIDYGETLETGRVTMVMEAK